MRKTVVAALLMLAACGENAPLPKSQWPGEIEVEAPTANQQISSPLRASGSANNGWYFEAVFPARLEAQDGTLIAEAPAIAASDWTQPGPVPFNVEMAFTVIAPTPAMLVLEQDMPGEGRRPERVEVPVILLPGSQ